MSSQKFGNSSYNFCFRNADYKVDDSCSITVTNGTPPTITPEKIQISPFYPKSSHCVLPLHPRFGKWIIPFGFDEHQTRSSVPSGTTLEIECDSNFMLIGPNELTCENGTWSDDVTQCTSRYHPYLSYKFLFYFCRNLSLLV